ncbi:hypothetical protein QJS10_CPA07g00466 [Acorus calamus]|uniref:Uncharacterized protein n=1 Tax=Acorus calamus TaxID=4465 RepID=A0AAV9EGZ3_ACOCL|nr:hypothetical protein QJS10_CPA07g00466 [Acorus calamus]
MDGGAAYLERWTFPPVNFTCHSSHICNAPFNPKTPYLYCPRAADVLPFVEVDVKKIVSRIIERTRELCISKSIEDLKQLCKLGSRAPGHPENTIIDGIKVVPAWLGYFLIKGDDLIEA